MKRRSLLLATWALGPFALTSWPRSDARGAPAKRYTIQAITVSNPWVPPSVTEAAALFLELVNQGPQPDRLIAAATPVAGTVIFREYDGTPLEYYQLWPKRRVELAPGKRYIALRDLKVPLALDDTFPVTLRFEKAGNLTVTATVVAGPDDDRDAAG
jgi:periplasmic copper chaperone A